MAVVQLANSSIDKINQRAWDIRYDDTDQARSLVSEAYQLALQAGDIYQQALALRTISVCASLKHEYEDAFKYADHSLHLFERVDDKENMVEILRHVSRLHWEFGDYATALEQTLTALEIAEASGNRLMTAHIYNNTAMNYAHLDQNEKMSDMLLRALAIFQELSDLEGIFITSNNLAMLRSFEGRHDEALDYALSIWNMSGLSKRAEWQVAILDTLGHIHYERGATDRALSSLMQAYEIARKNDLGRVQVQAVLKMGSIHQEQGQHERAAWFGETALETSAALNNPQMQLSSHQLLADVYEALGRYQEALTHHRAFFKFHSTLFAEERDRNFAKLEVRHRTSSALKEAEIYREQNVELEHEIEERMRIERELVEARDVAQIADRAKSRFIANMSHELRTPLNGVLGYTQLLMRDSTLDDTHRQGVSVIHQSGSHLLTLINDILDMSKIQAQKVSIEPAELYVPTFIEGIVGMMQLNAAQREVELRTHFAADLPTVVMADEKRLRQVLINLISNALKFTRQGYVEFRVHVTEQCERQATLCFDVCDTGIGIAPEHLKTIFEPFEQVGDQKQRQAGTGLGLAISRELVEAMGSTIVVESQLDRGSQFTFSVEFEIVGDLSPAVASAEAEPVPRPLVSEKLVVPQRAQLEQLLEHAISGDLLALQQTMTVLAEKNAKLGLFAQKIAGFAHTFDDESIIELLEHLLADE